MTTEEAKVVILAAVIVWLPILLIFKKWG